MSKNAIIGFAPVMALCAIRGKGEKAISRGMRWLGWWTGRGIALQDQQFKNRRGGGISKGVLVAISIPIFTSQLEKSRESTDLANIRSAYAEASAALLTEEGTTTGTDLISKVTYTPATSSAAATAEVTVTLKQGVDNWDSTSVEVGGVDLSANTTKPKANGTCTITVSADPNTLPTFVFSS